MWTLGIIFFVLCVLLMVLFLYVLGNRQRLLDQLRKEHSLQGSVLQEQQRRAYVAEQQLIALHVDLDRRYAGGPGALVSLNDLLNVKCALRMLREGR